MSNDAPSRARSSEPIFRIARCADLPGVVRLLADDVLGARREEYASPLPASYYSAFEVIDRDPHNELLVVESNDTIAGVLQLTYIPYLTYKGSWRALIEGVRVDASMRSSGIGRNLIAWAIDRARDKGCRLVQLTSDKTRPDAIRFYQTLGFVASHEGLKLHILEPDNQST